MKIPPKWLSRLLEWCTPTDRIDVLGDFEEWYTYLYQDKGARRANLIILLHSLSMLRLKVITRSKTNTQYMMNGLSFKIAIRNLKKNKLYGVINTLGLSVGLGACILIGMFIRHELSYDTHFEDYKEVYRVANVFDQGGDSKTRTTFTPFLLAPAMQNNLDSAVLYTRTDFLELSVEIGESDFWEEYAVAVDSNFFEVFKTRFIHGDPKMVLHEPTSIVLDRSTAEKYFKDELAIGRGIELNGVAYQVSGVIEDLPENTHFKANLFLLINDTRDR